MAAPNEGVFDPALVAAVRERLRHPPPANEYPAARWTLARIQATFPALPPRSVSGLWRLLRRLRIRLRHGRPQLYSPDPAYEQKEERLLAALRAVAPSQGRRVVVFLDECTVYHWPLVARDWSSLPGPAPCAARAAPGERRTRIVAALDAITGRVLFQRETAIGKHVFAQFLTQIAAAYPGAEQIDVVLDNWPVHHSPEVLETASNLRRIALVFLPTYAPWLNPIEKLWDWLKDAVLRLHRLAGQWPELKRQVIAFLNTFANGSRDLLRRVGLLGLGKLALALSTDLQNQK